MGIPDEVLLRGAGFARENFSNDYNPQNGHWYDLPPFGDQPEDQYWIQQGINYYNNILNK